MRTRSCRGGRCTRGVRGVAILAAALLVGPAAGEGGAAAPSCLASNTPKRTSVLTVSLTSQHRDGSEFAQAARIFWRGDGEGASDTLLCMTEPSDLRGLAYLVREEAGAARVWGYLPEQQRVLQIHAEAAARHSRIGRTAIGYDDLHYLPVNFAASTAEAAPAERLGGRSAMPLELSLPVGASPRYGRVLAWMGEASCVLLKIEFYDAANKLVKVVSADPESIRGSGGIRLARSIRIRDLKNEVETALRVEEVRIDGEIPDGIFSKRQLERGRCP